MPTITFLNCISDSEYMIVNVDHFRIHSLLWFGFNLFDSKMSKMKEPVCLLCNAM